MSRSALVGNITAMLEDAGFTVSDRCAIRPKSFDIAARRGDDVLLLKVLANIDAFDGYTGTEMRRLGEYLDATPLVIGLRTRDEELKPGVVYFRHGVPVFSPDTAMDLFIEEVPPLIYAAPGGLYVNIDGDLLSDIRSQEDMSLGKLANELGVSRRTVSKYEDGMSASVEVAAELEEIFDRKLASPVEVLSGAEEVRDDVDEPEAPEADPDDAEIVTVLTRVGFEVHPTMQAPFKAVSEDEKRERKVLTGHSEFNRTAEKRARIMSSVGHVTRTRSVYVVDSTKRDSVDGTALIEREEFERIHDSDELENLIRERAEG
ncbi:cro/C1 family transcription regulator [Natronomonas pharaonis DSM 2160]|uniref:Putative HTH-type transcriptional regulatory protein NP_1320A n=1 Tax=Natronomonas pharaonis (strain ATCC 35678 / DSM 2160 / CIP 103997 / JCM 8858 / NBRC 14720 / NCIMB 2260 / Gabara) TaxID=348780 RepID=Y1320_NATPD|nr:transcriptional regulator [Natronomonas pharaonis]Q3ISY4.1 RecName: Full=Putative HTH-type transcriptional regulatory protein NP_1320A [Natronomonas pharaonis DSM 2160]CAI48751.1 cro/C1 family transcription regulator [Natronomonas pharaonis DSM 2160]